MTKDSVTMRSVAHDIKGLLTRANLAVELLGRHDDETVRLKADRIMRAVDQIALICQRDLAPPINCSRAELHECREVVKLMEKVVSNARSGHEPQPRPVPYFD